MLRGFHSVLKAHNIQHLLDPTKYRAMSYDHEYTTLIKKFPEFIQKIQNTSLFIKIDIISFKVFPIDCNAFMSALNPILETFFILGVRYGHQSRLRFFHYLLSVAKTRSP